jgi:hypothetical protein
VKHGLGVLKDDKGKSEMAVWMNGDKIKKL